jgi:hypothetical protein
VLKKAMAGNGTKSSTERTAAIEYLTGLILFSMGPSDLMCRESREGFGNLWLGIWQIFANIASGFNA